MDFFGGFFDEFFGDFFGSIDILNTWPDPSKVSTTETWYENGTLKTGTMASGATGILIIGVAQ